MTIFELIDKFRRKSERIINHYRYKLILDKYCVVYSKYTFNGKIILNFEIGANIKFGDNFILSSGPFYSVDPAYMSSLHVKTNAYLKIGNNSGITGTTIHVHERIEIGNNVNIGAGCLIFDTNFHSVDYRIRIDRSIDLSFVETKPIIIKDNVFIGARSIITKGVTIGQNSIVGAGSVVVKSIPDNEVWGGNPAVFIKKIDL